MASSSTNGQDNPRHGMSVAAIKQGFLDNLVCIQGRFAKVATINDRYMALAYTIRDRLLYEWMRTSETYFERHSRTVCYLSAEFLLGPHLGNILINLRLRELVDSAMAELGMDLDLLLEQEEEPGLGNGGLGRLAACYLDSLSTLQIPAIGYGIRYEFGMFDQVIHGGRQVEQADRWLRLGNPWEIPRPEITFDIKLGGRTEAYCDSAGRYCVRWVPQRVVRGVAYDTPISGYGVSTANLLRLWKAEATESLVLKSFNFGVY
jgi:starch phosphorylase